jgi:hypothetical protein
MREDTRGEWEEGIRRCGALEVLKAWCEVRTGRTPGPSDVELKSGGVPAVLSGIIVSMSRLLEKLGPQR